MKKKTSLDYFKEACAATTKRLASDPEYRKKFEREVFGPPHVELVGEDKEQISLILQLLVPFRETNNQRTWSSYYYHNAKVYEVTGLGGDNYVINEYRKEDFKFYDNEYEVESPSDK